MFTGIIEEQGNILHVRPGTVSAELTVRASKVLEGTQVGDSIAVNGVCLTVTSLAGNSFTADVMAETMRKSNLGSLKPGSKVNLERALTPVSRLGGHFVSGHIDGVGEVSKMEREDNAVWFTIRAPQAITEVMVEKGSVAIDGISLTVVNVHTDSFTVSIIPHTMAETTLGQAAVGNAVNLENDVLGKYVFRFMKQIQQKDERRPQKDISEGFLAEHGFL